MPRNVAFLVQLAFPRGRIYHMLLAELFTYTMWRFRCQAQIGDGGTIEQRMHRATFPGIAHDICSLAELG